jgi:hypothetical protein
MYGLKPVPFKPAIWLWERTKGSGFPTHATVRLCHGWGTHFSCGLARLSAALPVGDFNSFEGRLNLTNH